MDDKKFDFTIIGGGIVGLATGLKLCQRFPNARIALLEKEALPARHQTGHNSGVMHSGIYYKPGTYKAKLARSGNKALVEFCQVHQIPHEICGKLIVASDESELPRLKNLFQRGQENQLSVRWLDARESKEIEPEVNAVAAIQVSSAGIVDYKVVSDCYLKEMRAAGAQAFFNTKVLKVKSRGGVHAVETTQGEFSSRFIINCGGLFSDRIARLSGKQVDDKVVPFRGEYFELVPEKNNLVKGMIYPTPNPTFPWLGVHLTRSIDGHIHAGPNAVLAFSREGYEKTDFNLGDAWETLTFPGFWKFSFKHYEEGLKEVYRSVSKELFLKSLQRLVPNIASRDLVSSPAGVRAMALTPAGSLVDDFAIIEDNRSVHVLNAPSPAATASLAIASVIVEKVERQFDFQKDLVIGVGDEGFGNRN